MLYDMPMVIFAGGKSSRMGQDKALMPFGKYNSLAQYQCERLSKIFKNIYISSKTNKFDFDIIAQLTKRREDFANTLLYRSK